jgi:hypothetical protein
MIKVECTAESFASQDLAAGGGARCTLVNEPRSLSKRAIQTLTELRKSARNGPGPTSATAGSIVVVAVCVGLPQP